MRRPGSRAGWLPWVLVTAAVLGPPDSWAQAPLRAGLKDLTLMGGYSVSHDRESVKSVNGSHGIPRLGLVLTEEHGLGWLRGNLEALAEPTVVHLRSEGSPPFTAGGLAAMGRWIFAASPPVRPYAEAGLGVVGGQVELRQTSCDVNFVLQGGVGALLFVTDTTAVTLGYRFQHVSNAGICRQNLGLNSSVFVFGISYFFP